MTEGREEMPGSEPPTEPYVPPQGEAGHAGERIGPYKLLSIIGEGGFGVVWLAERREPYVQRVAIKIIKAGMDSAAVIARFEQERQALAVMDHPNIAKVLDGGITPPELGSRPYFVMEYIKGEPITQYCDRLHLSIRERLELFTAVCEGVQHAHMKGIIHRDLKPGNILVKVVDSSPGTVPRVGTSGSIEGTAGNVHGALPKVIDFGVAKAISRTLTEKTIFTELGQMIGTPEYMSPEQAEMGTTDIDTRTDIYSLGVVLYELLAGALPFDRETLRKAAWATIVDIIRNREPPKPSTKLSSLGDTATTVAARRNLSGGESLVRELKDELDWITLRAMEKDRGRRYTTAAELAADIRGYLGGSLVIARPPSSSYRFRKFLKRNSRLVGTLSFIAALLVIENAVALELLRETRIANAKSIASEKTASSERQRAKESEALAIRNAAEANIAAAAGFIAGEDPVSAMQRLDACPAELRGWEWKRLRLEADGSIADRGTGDPALSACYTADGTAITVLGVSRVIRFDPQLDNPQDLESYRRASEPTSSTVWLGQADSGRRVLLASEENGAGRRLMWCSGASRVPIDLDEGLLINYDVRGACAAGAPIAVAAASRSGSPVLLIIHDRTIRSIPVEKMPAQVGISSDGGTIAAAWIDASGSCRLRAWKEESLESIDVPDGPGSVGSLNELAVLPGLEGAVVGGDAGIILWKRNGSVYDVRLCPQRADRVALSPDHGWVAAGDGHRLRMLNLASGGWTVLRGHSEPIRSVCFSPDSRRVVTTSRNCNVRLWDVRTDVVSSGLPEISGGCASSASRRWLVYSKTSPGAVALLDFATERCSVVCRNLPELMCAALDPPGRRVALVTSAEVSVIDADSGARLKSWPTSVLGLVPSAKYGAAISFVPKEDDLLAVALATSDEVRVQAIDLRDGRVRDLTSIRQPFRPILVAFDGFGLLGGSGFQLRGWWLGLEAPPLSIEVLNTVAGLSLSPDGTRIAAVGEGGDVYLAPAEGPKYSQLESGHRPGGRAVAWFDAHRMASADKEGAVVLWAPDPLRSLYVEHQSAGTAALAFDRESGSLWVATADGRLIAMRSR